MMDHFQKIILNIARDEDYGRQFQLIHSLILDQSKANCSKDIARELLEALSDITVKEQYNLRTKFFAVLIARDLSLKRYSNFLSLLSSSQFLQNLSDIAMKVDPHLPMEQKGLQTFGNPQLGNRYMRLILECLVKWGQKYPQTANKSPTKFKNSLDQLIYSNVVLPNKFNYFEDINIREDEALLALQSTTSKLDPKTIQSNLKTSLHRIQGFRTFLINSSRNDEMERDLTKYQKQFREDQKRLTEKQQEIYRLVSPNWINILLQIMAFYGAQNVAHNQFIKDRLDYRGYTDRMLQNCQSLVPHFRQNLAGSQELRQNQHPLGKPLDISNIRATEDIRKDTYDSRINELRDSRLANPVSGYVPPRMVANNYQNEINPMRMSPDGQIPTLSPPRNVGMPVGGPPIVSPPPSTTNIRVTPPGAPSAAPHLEHYRTTFNPEVRASQTSLGHPLPVPPAVQIPQTRSSQLLSSTAAVVRTSQANMPPTVGMPPPNLQFDHMMARVLRIPTQQSTFKSINAQLQREKTKSALRTPKSPSVLQRSRARRQRSANIEQREPVMTKVSIFKMFPNPQVSRIECSGTVVQPYDFHSQFKNMSQYQKFRRWKTSSFKDKSLVFDDDLLQIGFKSKAIYETVNNVRKIFLRFTLYFGNKTQNRLQQIEIEYEGDNTYCLYGNPRKLEPTTESGYQTKQQIILLPLAMPYNLVSLKLGYLTESGDYHNHRIYLPTTILKFTEFHRILPDAFSKSWQMFKNKKMILKTQPVRLCQNLPPMAVKHYMKALTDMNDYGEFLDGSKTQHRMCTVAVLMQDIDFLLKVRIRQDMTIVWQLALPELNQQVEEHGRFILQTLCYLFSQ